MDTRSATPGESRARRPPLLARLAGSLGRWLCRLTIGDRVVGEGSVTLLLVDPLAFWVRAAGDDPARTVILDGPVAERAGRQLRERSWTCDAGYLPWGTRVWFAGRRVGAGFEHVVVEASVVSWTDDQGPVVVRGGEK